MHRRDDSTVPFSDAERLRRAAPHAQLVPVEGDHDLREALGPHADEMVAFMVTACRDERVATPEAADEKAKAAALRDRELRSRLVRRRRRRSRRALQRVLGLSCGAKIVEMV